MKIRLGLACFDGLLLLGCRAKDNFLKEAENLALFFGLLQNGRVVDSGQTTCYDDIGYSMPCGGTSLPRQDADYIGVPKPRSVSRPIRIENPLFGETSLVTFDYGTGLVWTSCRLTVAGEPNTDLECNGNAQQLGQNFATQYCNRLNTYTYGGRSSGWRLPSIRELRSLAEYGNSAQPYISSISFPHGTGAWNSPPGVVMTNNEQIRIVFSDLLVSATGGAATVFCVNGPPMTYGRFTFTVDGAVKDTDTGLVFTRCAKGQNESADCAGTADTMDWAQALTYCTNLSKGGRSWRLPGIHELEVILSSIDAPYVDSNYFSNTTSSGYWTSTSISSATNFAFILMETGAYSKAGKTTPGSTAICVSGP